MKKAILITGWGVGTAVLTPLTQLLQDQINIKVIDVFDTDQITTSLQAEFEQADVVMGWSLGGQLALYMADSLWKKKGIAKPILTFASNPCFVQQPTWQNAMAKIAFESFQHHVLNHQTSTLKQFYLNICKGEKQQKQAWRTLCQQANPILGEPLNKTLTLLETLNLVEILRQYPAYSHHVYAQDDTLVPSGVSESVNQLSSTISTIVLENASHSFPVFEPERAAKQIQQFLMHIAIES